MGRVTRVTSQRHLCICSMLAYERSRRALELGLFPTTGRAETLATTALAPPFGQPMQLSYEEPPPLEATALARYRRSVLVYVNGNRHEVAAADSNQTLLEWLRGLGATFPESCHAQHASTHRHAPHTPSLAAYTRSVRTTRSRTNMPRLCLARATGTRRNSLD